MISPDFCRILNLSFWFRRIFGFADYTSVVMLKQICTAFHPEVFMQLIEGYWKVFVLMGIGYLLHFAPDSWQNACCRGVVKLPLLGKALLLVVLIYLVIQIKSSDIQPFIYFQF